MELRQLRYFVAVAEEHHFGRAARRLRIATPTLSQQLRVLERDLGVVLVHRRPGQVTISPAGEVLLRHARILLARAERLRHEVLAAHGRGVEQIMLRVAGGAEHVLGPELDRLTGESTRAAVVLVPSVTIDALRAVDEESADAAIVWDAPGEDRGLTAALLRHVPVLLAMPAAHRLAAADRVAVAELAGETIVLFPRSMSPALWDRLCRHLLPGGAVRPRQIIVQPDSVNAPEALLRAVAAGRGLAPVLTPITGHAASDGVAMRPLEPPMTVPLQLIWREPASASLRQLVAALIPAQRQG